MPQWNNFHSLLQFCQSLAVPLQDNQQDLIEHIHLRQNRLTKPQGSLGRLEDLVQWVCLCQRTPSPRLSGIYTLIFAGNHGIVDQGISQYPQNVTAQMIENFASGGAAINQISNIVQAHLKIIPLNHLRPTADFSRKPAMTETEFLRAVKEGYNAVPKTADLLTLGEMGIGNTTAAAALSCALLGGSAHNWAGAGTGLDETGQHHKANVITAALKRHGQRVTSPLHWASYVGGYELAAILGATLAARVHNIPVLLDGFVCTAAVTPLACISATLLDHCVLGHLSTEKGHCLLSHQLKLTPLLDLGMHLGEGTGAALAINIVQAAVQCFNHMSTFEEARISERKKNALSSIP